MEVDQNKKHLSQQDLSSDVSFTFSYMVGALLKVGLPPPRNGKRDATAPLGHDLHRQDSHGIGCLQQWYVLLFVGVFSKGVIKKAMTHT